MPPLAAGFYACNRYEAAKATGVYEDSEKRRQNAKNSLERRGPSLSKAAATRTAAAAAAAAAAATPCRPDDSLQRRVARPVATPRDRYMHYFERWAAHGTAHKKALEDLRDMTNQKLHKRVDPPRPVGIGPTIPMG